MDVGYWTSFEALILNAVSRLRALENAKNHLTMLPKFHMYKSRLCFAFLRCIVSGLKFYFVELDLLVKLTKRIIYVTLS